MFYIVPPRRVGTLQQQIVTSFNGLTGDLILIVNDGLSLTVDPVLNELTLGFDSSTFVPSTGGTMTGNLNFNLTAGVNVYGLGLYYKAGSDPSVTRIGALYFNTDTGTVRVFNGSVWTDVGGSVGGSGITTLTAGFGILANGVPGGVLTSSGTIAVQQSANFTWSGNHVFQGSVTFNQPVVFAAGQTFNGPGLTFISQPTGALIYQGMSGWTTLSPGSNNYVLSLNSSLPTWVDPSTLFSTPNVPTWVKATISHSSVSTLSGTAGNVNYVLLPPGSVVQAVKIKHSIQFAGAGITNLTASVGTVSDPSKYLQAFQINSAVSSTNMDISMIMIAEDHVSSVQAIVRFASNVLLSNVTAGSVDVWILYAVVV
jgi:hypothetical protein